MRRTRGPHIHKRRRADSRPNMDGYGLDGLRACQKACQCSTHVPLHAIQVVIRLLPVPFLFDCVIGRLDAGPSNYVARTVCGAESAPDHLLKELLHLGGVGQGDRDQVWLPVRVHHEGFQAGLDLPEQAAGMRMQKNAYECIRMHMNTYECIRMHTNA